MFHSYIEYLNSMEIRILKSKAKITLQNVSEYNFTMKVQRLYKM